MNAGSVGYPLYILPVDQYGNAIDMESATSVVLATVYPGGQITNQMMLTVGDSALTLEDGTVVPAYNWASYTTLARDFQLAGGYSATVFVTLGTGEVVASSPFVINVGATANGPTAVALNTLPPPPATLDYVPVAILQDSGNSANQPTSVALPAAPTPGNLLLLFVGANPTATMPTFTGFGQVEAYDNSDGNEACLLFARMAQVGDTDTFAFDTTVTWNDDGNVRLFEISGASGDIVALAGNLPDGSGTSGLLTNAAPLWDVGPTIAPNDPQLRFGAGVAIAAYTSEQLTGPSTAAPDWTDLGTSGTRHGLAVQSFAFAAQKSLYPKWSGTNVPDSASAYHAPAAIMVIVYPLLNFT